MKVRIGFVSNSSSASFVMIGAHVPNVNRVELAKKLLVMFPGTVLPCPEGCDEEDWACDVLWDAEELTQFVYYGEESLLGFRIYSGHSDDYGLGDFSMSIKDVEKAVRETRVIMKELGIPVEEVKLIGGERSC